MQSDLCTELALHSVRGSVVCMYRWHHRSPKLPHKKSGLAYVGHRPIHVASGRSNKVPVVVDRLTLAPLSCRLGHLNYILNVYQILSKFIMWPNLLRNTLHNQVPGGAIWLYLSAVWTTPHESRPQGEDAPVLWFHCWSRHVSETVPSRLTAESSTPSVVWLCNYHNSWYGIKFRGHKTIFNEHVPSYLPSKATGMYMMCRYGHGISSLLFF